MRTFPSGARRTFSRPEGLALHADCVSGCEAEALLAQVDALPWRSDLRRRVQHHGYRYDYRARQATAADRIGPLPAFLADLARQLASEGLFAVPPDQVIVNEYLPGQGIAAHVDCRPCFGDVIASLSLGSACVMRLQEVGGDGRLDLALPPRSLVTLRGPARHGWTHAIPARKSDLIDGTRIRRGRRVSLTFRTMRLEG